MALSLQYEKGENIFPFIGKEDGFGLLIKPLDTVLLHSVEAMMRI